MLFSSSPRAGLSLSASLEQGSGRIGRPTGKLRRCLDKKFVAQEKQDPLHRQAWQWVSPWSSKGQGEGPASENRREKPRPRPRGCRVLSCPSSSSLSAHSVCTLLPGFLHRGCLGKPFLVPLAFGLFFLNTSLTQRGPAAGLGKVSGLLVDSFTLTRGPGLLADSFMLTTGPVLGGIKEARGTWGRSEPRSSMGGCAGDTEEHGGSV